VGNTKIKSIKEQLSQYYSEIENFKFRGGISNSYKLDRNDTEIFLDNIAKFMYFILNIPELKDIFLSLINSYEKLSNSDEVKKLNENCWNNFRKIAGIIKESSSYKKFLKTEIAHQEALVNLFNEKQKYLSTKQFLDYLETDSNYFGNTANKIHSILSILVDIISKKNYIADESLFSKIQSYHEENCRCKELLQDKFNFELDYAGYYQAVKILGVFMNYYSDYKKFGIQNRKAEEEAYILGILIVDEGLPKKLFKEYKAATRKISSILSAQLDILTTDNPLVEQIMKEQDDINLFVKTVCKNSLFEIKEGNVFLEIRRECENEQNFKNLILAISNLIDWMNNDTLLKLIKSNRPKKIKKAKQEGTISLLEIFLKEWDSNYDQDIIKNLRRIKKLRRKMHGNTDDFIPALKELDINYPVSDWSRVRLKVLQSYLQSLKKLRNFFAEKAKEKNK